MQYLLLTRHAHSNELLGKYLGVGELVGVEDPKLVEQLLAMRGGHSYGHVGFGGHSGQGYPYFSPENFNLYQLAEALKAPKAPKVEGPSEEELKAQAAAEAKKKADEEAAAAAKAAEEAAAAQAVADAAAQAQQAEVQPEAASEAAEAQTEAKPKAKK